MTFEAADYASACRHTHTPGAGYDDAVRWARSFGTIAIAGVEGTSKTPTAAPKKRFCGYSNEPSLAKYSDC